MLRRSKRKRTVPPRMAELDRPRSSVTYTTATAPVIGTSTTAVPTIPSHSTSLTAAYQPVHIPTVFCSNPTALPVPVLSGSNTSLAAAGSPPLLPNLNPDSGDAGNFQKFLEINTIKDIDNDSCILHNVVGNNFEKMDNSMLNRFYEDHVKMVQDETRQNIDVVLPLVHDILKYVHDRDPRFKIQTINVGSYYSHLKVARADEFDYSVVLETPALEWVTGTPACYGFDQFNQVVATVVPLPSPPCGNCFTRLGQWNQHKLNEGPACLTVGEHVVPIKVKRWFKKLVGEAVNRPQIKKYVDARRLSESPATTLSVTHPRIAGQCISIDLAPLIEARLPFKPEFGWPRQRAFWPNQQKIEKIKTLGINEVAKDPFYWSLSFVTCEKELLDCIDINGTCRKKSQRIMKKLRERWCPHGMKQELTSYHLKNILFWECENHPYDSEWEHDQLATRITSMCYLLVQSIQRGTLPLYFHIGVNLFENKDIDVLRQVEKNIMNFLHNPDTVLSDN